MAKVGVSLILDEEVAVRWARINMEIFSPLVKEPSFLIYSYFSVTESEDA